MKAISPVLQENKDLFIGELENSIKTLGLNWQPITDTFYFNRPQSQCSIVNISLPEHEKTVTNQKEFKKSDFPQLVVKLDCKKTK